MTAVPKPLKFLRPHYDELTALYEKWPVGDDKVRWDRLNIVESTLLTYIMVGFARRHALGIGHDVRRRREARDFKISPFDKS